MTRVNRGPRARGGRARVIVSPIAAEPNGQLRRPPAMGATRPATIDAARKLDELFRAHERRVLAYAIRRTRALRMPGIAAGLHVASQARAGDAPWLSIARRVISEPARPSASGGCCWWAAASAESAILPERDDRLIALAAWRLPAATRMPSWLGGSTTGPRDSCWGCPMQSPSTGRRASGSDQPEESGPSGHH
jgi:hypothetical protein